MTDTLDNAASVLAGRRQFDDGDAGVYRANRCIFTDPEIFELEMKHIFEGNWIYLAHESQIPNNNDYFTTYMGRQPIFITREQGRRARLPHQRLHPSRRDAVPPQERATRRRYTCPFHGWTFSNVRQAAEGEGPEGAGYPDDFNKEGSHDLTKVARSRATAASCSAASTPMSCRWPSTSAKRPRSST